MPPQPPEASSNASGLPIVWAMLCGLASAVTLPIRYGEGLLGVGGRTGIYAVAVIVLYAVFIPCPILLTYAMAFIAITLIKRATSATRHHFGNRQVSGFEGWPLACLIGLPYGWCKQVVEPGMVYAVGWYLRQADPALGCFFIAGAVATGLKTLFENVLQFNRDVATFDQRERMRIDAQKRAKRGW